MNNLTILIIADLIILILIYILMRKEINLLKEYLNISERR